MTRRLWLAAFALLVVVPHAGAQEPLTLERAVATALSENASLRAARSASGEAAAHIAEARSGFLPRVSFVESWQRGNQPVFVFGSLLSARRFTAANFAVDALNHPDATGLFHASLGVEQLLFDGGRQRSAVTAAALQRDLADSAADQAAAGVMLATTLAFGRVVSGEASRRASEAGVAAAEEDLQRAQRRRDAGMATDADVLGLVVHVADLRQRSIQARGESAIARAELNRLMGAPIDREFQVVEPPTDPGSGGETPDVSALLAEADAARPELRRAAVSERLAGARLRQARAAFVPQVAAQAVLDANGLRFNDRASAWLVGAEVRWTLSIGGAERAQIKAATAAAARTRAEHEDARAAVHVEVVSALRRLESARARQAASRAAVDQARESQRIVRDRFEAGIASVSDVLRASTAVLDAESHRASALVDAVVSEAMLRRALGRTQ